MSVVAQALPPGRSALRARLSASDATLLDQLAEARARLSKLTVAGPEAGQEEAYGKEVAALEDKVRLLDALYDQLHGSVERAATELLQMIGPAEGAGPYRAVGASGRGEG